MQKNLKYRLPLKLFTILVLLCLSRYVHAQHSIDHSKKGLELLINKKYKKAYQTFNKAIKNNESLNYPDLYYYQGICLFNRYFINSKKQKKTIDVFSDYIEKRPYDSRGYLRRGIVYLNRFQYNLAANDFKESISLNPLLADIYFYYALCLSQISDTNNVEAHNNYSIFISMIDSSNNLYNAAHNNRGIIRKMLNDGKANDDFIKIRNDDLKITIHSSPIGLSYYDTISHINYNNETLLNICGILVTQNQYDSNILIRDFVKITKLSDLIHIDSVFSYEFFIIKNSWDYKEYTKLEKKNFRFVDSKTDNFDIDILNYINNLQVGDQVAFHQIIGSNKTSERKGYPALLYKVDLTFLGKD